MRDHVYLDTGIRRRRGGADTSSRTIDGPGTGWYRSCRFISGNEGTYESRYGQVGEYEPAWTRGQER